MGEIWLDFWNGKYYGKYISQSQLSFKNQHLNEEKLCTLVVVNPFGEIESRANKRPQGGRPVLNLLGLQWQMEMFMAKIMVKFFLKINQWLHNKPQFLENEKFEIISHISCQHLSCRNIIPWLACDVPVCAARMTRYAERAEYGTNYTNDGCNVCCPVLSSTYAELYDGRCTKSTADN